MSQLKLFLLGPPRVELEGVAVEIKRRKGLAILSYLAVTNERQPRETLATLLWPESSHRRARKALRRDLSELNLALAGAWLEADQASVGLRAGFWLDVAQFQADVAHEAAAPQTLIAAAALYRDDFLTGFTLPDCVAFDEWQFFQTESLRQALASALERLVDLLRDQADYEGAIPYARRWLALDPLHEAAHRRLMQLYAQAGQQIAARRQYEVCCQTLEDELDISPSEETTALYNDIRNGKMAITSVVTPAPLLPRSPAPRGHNLPTQTTTFIGREQELADIQRLLLDEPDCRLLNLVGPGGIGKTRLALAAATQTLDACPDGAYFVSLAPVGEVEYIVPAMAEALRFTFYGSTDPKDQLLDYLGQKRMLLLMDNFEHLFEGADLLSDILSHAPAVTLLATSRERLHLQEEWVYEVQGLHFPAVKGETSQVSETAEALTSYSAVELFTQRARQTEANFAPSAAELADIVRICQLVEGMPLGIELAAPWIKVLSCQEIAVEIKRSLDFLTTTLRNVPERHRSLRVVFEQTWGRLSAGEQAVLRQLSVFRGGCTREAAEYVSGVTLPLLTALVDKALLRRTASGRYELHELLRQFASAKLDEAQQIAAARNRHLRYYMDLAEEVEPQLRVGGQVAQRYMQLEAEHDNLRAALNWALSGGEFAPGLRLVGALYDFWAGRGYRHEGQAQAERYLTHAEAAARTAEWARALLTAGGLAANQHNYHTAQPLLSESEAIARTLGSDGRFILARACLELGWTMLACLDFATAQRYGQESLALGQALDEPWLRGQALIVLGATASDQGDYATAGQRFAAAVECCQPLGRTGVYGEALSSLGFLRYSQGDYRGAHTHLAQSVAIFNALGDRLAMAWSLLGMGDIAAAQNNAAEAEGLYNQALTIQHELNDQDHAGNTLEAMGRLAQRQGDYERAQALLRESLALRIKMGYRPGIASTLEAIGSRAAAQGQAERAARLFGAVEALLQQDNAFLNPVLQPWHDTLVSTLRDQLGERAFTTASAAGAAMEMDEVIALALNDDGELLETGDRQINPEDNSS